MYDLLSSFAISVGQQYAAVGVVLKICYYLFDDDIIIPPLLKFVFVFRVPVLGIVFMTLSL